MDFELNIYPGTGKIVCCGGGGEWVGGLMQF